MKTKYRWHGRWLALELAGEFDLWAAPAFREAVESAHRDDMAGLVVDVSEVSFMDSSGLGALLGCYRRMQAEGRGFALAAPSHRLREVLGLSGLDRTIEVFPSVDDALDAGPREGGDDE